MPGYDVHLDLAGRDVLVLGGGPAAARRARSCADAGARVLVLSDAVCEDLRLLHAQGVVTWQPRSWTAADLGRAWLVHALTGDAGQDQQVVTAAEDARVFCLTGPAGPEGSDDPAAPGSASTPSAWLVPSRRPPGDGRGRVALVGGGPGDPGLITAWGLALLREADVVVVDRLAPTALLEGLDPDVEVIDVGKVPDHHPVPQEEINRLLVEHARAGRRVVRLKGGDPYVLGRGREEEAACTAADVPVVVVPGVTSAFSVPAAAGIPVTHRGLARSVTVLTGHDDPDYEALVHLGGTLVVLMGVSRLETLSEGLLGAGMDPLTPVAIVESGWTARQRTSSTTVGQVARCVVERRIQAPAVVVIGDVAALARSDGG